MGWAKRDPAWDRYLSLVRLDLTGSRSGRLTVA